ncbi:MAG: leucine-rich repeat protein [Huintestinicola sp.]|uniref:leucine-rich repeat protein n=1 Tax=Huintestinicola sp. TaxID=2981661 RepID=UPI003F09C846
MIRMSNKTLCENCFAEISSEPCSECGFDKSKPNRDRSVLPVGSVLEGRYMIGRVIGKGGFGITYLAYDMKLSCKVAIKEYYPYGVAVRGSGSTMVMTSDDNQTSFKEGADRFYNEARLVAGFNGNPNIVSVYDFFYGNDTVYFTMGYLQGINLKAYIQKNGAITPGQAVFLANEISNALVTAHNSNVLHRDISPDNIMICNDGALKLLDFGAARQVIAEGSQSLSVILKQGYAPLEQYQKKGKQGPWTDIYSLGATLYYALTLDLLDDPMSRLEDDEEYSSNVHNIPDELWEIIKKATELKITDRYQDIYEFKEAFADISIKPEPFIKRDFKQQAENYRKAAHSRTVSVKSEKPASDVTVPLQQSGSAMDVTTPLNQSSSAPMDVTMPLNQSSSAPMDVTMPLNQGSSAPMDVTMPLNQGSSAPMDVTMPLNQSSSAPMDVTMPLKQDSSAPMDVTMPLKQDSSDMNVTMPLKHSSSAEEKTPSPVADGTAAIAKASKKRIKMICVFAAIAAVAVIIGIIASATGEHKYGDYKYLSSGGEITITEYIGSGKTAEIPSEIKGKPVTLIGESAFLGSEITSVTIPDSVTAIDLYAFGWCDKLVNVSIPDGCNVNEDAFCASSNVKIEIRGKDSSDAKSEQSSETKSEESEPEQPSEPKPEESKPEQPSEPKPEENGPEQPSRPEQEPLEDSTDELEYEVMQDGTVSITRLKGSSTAENIVIPREIDGKPVTVIADNAFYNCRQLKSVIIPDTVTYIGLSTFEWCYNLTSVTIPDSVTYIDECAFSNCLGLTSVTLPDSMTVIAAGTFAYCENLTSITIPSSITVIQGEAFNGCVGLKSITIPDSVTEIQYNAFGECTALEKVSVSENCQINEYAFKESNKVKIEIRKNNSSGAGPEQAPGIDTSDVKKAYTERLKNTDNLYGYYLFDMDNDGLSELIVKRGDNFSDSLSGMYEFYAYDEYRKSTILLGVYEYLHEELCLDKNEKLVVSGAWQGMWLRKIIYDGTKISTEDIYNLSIMSTEEEMNKAYKDFPTHELAFAEAEDMSLLDNILKQPQGSR